MRTRGWTKEQDDKLKHFCNLDVFVPMSIISKEINKSERTIYDRIAFLGLKRPSYNWSKEQDDIVEELYPKSNIPVSVIARKVGKTERAVRIRARKLKVARFDSEEVRNYILEHYGEDGISASDIANKFNRPLATIYRMAIELGKTKKHEFGQITTGQMKIIIERYADENTYVLSAELGLPDYTIRKLATKNSIRKNRKEKVRIVKPRKTHKWTTEEEAVILNKHQNTTMQEIASVLNVSYNSVKGKIATMGLSDRNLKIYKSGGITFTYNTSDEKQKKIDYAIMFRDLINQARIGDVYR